MKEAYLYCDRRSLNDATIYYVRLVLDCLSSKGYEIKTVFSLKDIKHPSLIFTISNFFYTKAKFRYPFVKTINWKQGIAFEEAKMNRPFYKWIPFYFCELLAVQTVNMQMFVSDMMNLYYRGHYFFHSNNFVVMPCYNLGLNKHFSEQKYEKPTFVYAGGISKWQSIDVILDTYALIENEIPSSSLVMYSKDKEFLLEEAAKRGIKNFKVKYVPLDQLQSELANYKYGFIPREKNWVNLVATPTKMNSYLAAYVIPIFSDGVDDFKRNIQLGEFTIMAKTPLIPRLIADEILNFEKKQHDFSSLKNIIYSTFNNHYNDEKYKRQILKKMEECNI